VIQNSDLFLHQSSKIGNASIVIDANTHQKSNKDYSYTEANEMGDAHM